MLSICACTICTLCLIPIIGLTTEIKNEVFTKETNLSSSWLVMGSLAVLRKKKANNMNLLFIQYYSMQSPFKCLQEKTLQFEEQKLMLLLTFLSQSRWDFGIWRQTPSPKKRKNDQIYKICNKYPRVQHMTLSECDKLAASLQQPYPDLQLPLRHSQYWRNLTIAGADHDFMHIPSSFLPL